MHKLNLTGFCSKSGCFDQEYAARCWLLKKNKKTAKIIARMLQPSTGIICFSYCIKESHRLFRGANCSSAAVKKLGRLWSCWLHSDCNFSPLFPPPAHCFVMNCWSWGGATASDQQSDAGVAMTPLRSPLPHVSQHGSDWRP